LAPEPPELGPPAQVLIRAHHIIMPKQGKNLPSSEAHGGKGPSKFKIHRPDDDAVLALQLKRSLHLHDGLHKKASSKVGVYEII